MKSLLRSYALSRIMRSFNMEVGFLTIESRDGDSMLLQGAIDDFQKETESNGSLSKIKKLDKYFATRLTEVLLLKLVSALEILWLSQRQFRIY